MQLSVFYDHILDAAAQQGKPVAEICKLVRGFGITSVEVENKFILADRSGVTSNLQAGGLTINCINAVCDFTHDPSAAQCRELIGLAADLGVKKVLAVPGFIKEGENAEELTRNVEKALTELCARAREKGITVGIEDFDSSAAPYSTLSQVLRLLQNVPGLACTFDTGNFLYNGEDVLQACELLKVKITHVHCKDRTFSVTPGETPTRAADGGEMYSSPVGYGLIPMRQLVTSLLRQGYRGSFAIEHFGSLNQLDFMQKSASWLLNLENQVLL